MQRPVAESMETSDWTPLRVLSSISASLRATGGDLEQAKAGRDRGATGKTPASPPLVDRDPSAALCELCVATRLRLCSLMPDAQCSRQPGCMRHHQLLPASSRLEQEAISFQDCVFDGQADPDRQDDAALTTFADLGIRGQQRPRPTCTRSRCDPNGSAFE